MQTENKIQPTQSELEMIALLRKEQELKEEKARIQRLKECEDIIARNLEESKQFENLCRLRGIQVGKIVSDLEEKYPGMYKLKTADHVKDFVAYTYDYIEGQGSGKRIDLATVKVPFLVWEIESVKYPEFKIVFDEHRLYTSYGSTKGTSFEMQLHGPSMKSSQRNRFYKSIKTINDRLNEFGKSLEYDRNQAKLKASGSQKALEFLSKKYPNAKCEIQQTGERSNYSGRMGYDWVSFKVIVVTFPNKYSISFKYDWNGEKLSTWYYKTEANPFNMDEVIEMMSNYKSI